MMLLLIPDESESSGPTARYSCRRFGAARGSAENAYCDIAAGKQ
jgi:hypothetical protein